MIIFVIMVWDLFICLVLCLFMLLLDYYFFEVDKGDGGKVVFLNVVFDEDVFFVVYMFFVGKVDLVFVSQVKEFDLNRFNFYDLQWADFFKEMVQYGGFYFFVVKFVVVMVVDQYIGDWFFFQINQIVVLKFFFCGLGCLRCYSDGYVFYFQVRNIFYYSWVGYIVIGFYRIQ